MDEKEKQVKDNDQGEGTWPETTQTLLDGLWRGEKEDWDKFWKRYERPIKRYIILWLCSRNWSKDNAERVASEQIGGVIERFFKQVKNYDKNHNGEGVARFRTFLRVLITNAIKDALAKANRIAEKEKVVAAAEYKIESNTADKIESNAEGAAKYFSVDDRCDPFTKERKEEESLWNLAIAVEVLEYVIQRFAWSPLDRKIIELLKENYRDNEIIMERGIIKNIAAKLNCSESQVSTTRSFLYKRFLMKLKTYRDENLMLQKNPLPDPVLEKIERRYYLLSRDRANEK